jgi:hypothetical protein
LPVRWLGSKDPRSRQTDTRTREFWIGSGKSKAFGDDDRGGIKEKASGLTFNEGTKKFGPIQMKWLPRITGKYGSGDPI